LGFHGGGCGGEEAVVVDGFVEGAEGAGCCSVQH
jgi:hypothetical protein